MDITIEAYMMFYFSSIQKPFVRVSITSLAILFAYSIGIQAANAEWGKLSLQGEGVSEVRFEQTDATASYGWAGISLSVLTLNINYTLKQYSWDNADILPFGNAKDDPWKTLHSLSFEGMYGDEISGPWSYLVMLEGSTAFEDSADTFPLSASGGAGAIYRHSGTWSFVLGAGGAYSERDEEWTPFPVGGVLWNRDSESGWSASLVFPVDISLRYATKAHIFSTSADIQARTVTLGYQTAPERFSIFAVGSFEDIIAEAGMAYHFSPAFSAALGYSLNGMAHRLADDNPLIPVGTEKGYLHAEEECVSLLAQWSFLERVNLRVGPYYVLSSTLSIRDKQDTSLQTVNAEDAFGGKLTLSFSF